jgi:hypothetical protein
VCPTSAQHALGLRGTATELDGLARRGPRCVEPAHRPLPTPALGAHRAYDNDGACMQSSLRSTTEGKQLRHEPRQGLHHEHPRRTANPPDMARRTKSKLGGRAMGRWKLTDAAPAWELTDKEEVA